MRGADVANKPMLNAALLPNLRSILPGETLYSWAGYVHASNASADVRETSLGLYGTRYSALLHDFPAHVLALDRRLEGSLGDPRVLALQHTLLGYFTACLPKDEAEAILRATLSGSCSNIKTKLGIAASRVGGYHPLKACPKCISLDAPRHGRAYWHIEHQFPSALVCIEHGVALRWVRDRITPVHRRVWTLPAAEPAPDWVEIDVVDQRQLDLLSRLSVYSFRWAMIGPGELDPARLTATYRLAFKDRGWITESGSVRLARVTRALREHYNGLEFLPGLGVLRSIRSDWPGLVGTLARNRPRNGHPLKHLLVIALLFDTWEQFELLYQTQPSFSASTRDDEQREFENASNEQKTKMFRALVAVDGLSLSAAARSLGVSTATGVRWATLLGLDFTHRAKSLTPDRLARVRAMLRSGADKASISKTCCISIASISRLISSAPDIAAAWRCARHDIALKANRRQFLDLLASHPGWPVKQLRTIPGNAYSWLYRHDREWLRAHLPALWAM